jgi:hypothetical protein
LRVGKIEPNSVGAFERGNTYFQQSLILPAGLFVDPLTTRQSFHEVSRFREQQPDLFGWGL